MSFEYLEDLEDMQWITLHNIYREQVKQEDRARKERVSDEDWERLLEEEGLSCSVCSQKWIPFKSRVILHETYSWNEAISAWCSQCVSDYFGAGAETRFMNMDIDKNDRWLLTPKGEAALAAEPDNSLLQYID